MKINTDWESISYGTVTGTRLFIPVNPLRKGNINLKKKDRKFDIEIQNGEIDTDIITLQLPENAEVEALPSPTIFSNQFGRFESEAKKNGNEIIIKQLFLLKSGKWEAAAYPELLTLMENVNNGYNGKIVIKMKE